MKQGKTLRLTSIVLALMMFFAMISVLLVPAGTAGAAEDNARVEIIIGTDPTTGRLDSDNVVERKAQTVTIEVNEYFRNDDRDYEKLLITMINPNGAEVTDHIRKDMTLRNGKYYYDFPITNNRILGLFTAKLTRVFSDGKGYQWEETTPLTVGAFWLYEPIEFIAAGGQNPSQSKFDTKEFAAIAKQKFYVAPGAKGNLNISIPHENNVIPSGAANYNANGPEDIIARLIDPVRAKILKSYDKEMTTAVGQTALFTNIPYTVATDAEHLSELHFGALIVRDIERSPGYCYLVKTKLVDRNDVDAGAPVETANIAIVDAKAPEIGEIVIQDNSLIGWLYDNKVLRNNALKGEPKPLPVGGEYTHLEVSDISDPDSGFVKNVNQPTNAYVLFENPFNSKVTVGGVTGALEDTRLVAVDAANSKDDSYFMSEKDANTSLLFALAGYSRTTTEYAFYDTYLLNNRFRVKVVATDGVGNRSEKEYGVVDFLNDYVQINQIRVEQQNVLEMYVGQTINYEDVLFNGVKVFVNSDASFPDNYIWFGKNDTNTLSLFEFDYDNKTIKAVKEGEGQIYVEPWINFKQETALPGASFNGYMRVIVHKEPTVTSLTLSSSKLELAVNAEHKLTATTVPAGTPITWSSSNPAIATVDANGNVKGVAKGTATISAASGGKYAVCTVEVSGPIEATGITLNKSSMTLSVPNTETLFATLTPAGATTAISWNTSDASVATVDNAGKVTAVKNGKATITATAGAYSAKCEVTVADVEGPTNDGWGEKDGNKVYYVQGKLILGWRRIDGYWYYFAPENGYLRGKGWLKEGSKWYYLNSDGKMKEGEWLKEGGKWYWLKISTGAMAQSEWYKVNGVWYLFDDNGRMLTGWQKVRGIWYYMKSSGAMYEGWLQDGGVWYYLTPTGGAMVTGRVVIGGRTSDFAASGRWLGYVK